MISLKEVKHLAKLARLGLSKKELQKLQKNLGEILGYVEILEKADASGVKPISHITGLYNKGRGDEEHEKLSSANEVLKAVPEKEERWVKTPLIIKSKAQSPKSKIQKFLIFCCSFGFWILHFRFIYDKRIA